MSGKQVVILLGSVLILGCLQVAAATETDNKTNDFVATDEWQTIAEG